MTLETSVGAPFQNVDAIAATPDGKKITFVDRNTSHVGKYDVEGLGFTDLGPVSGLPTLSVLAAYGLDGNLYVASNTTNALYRIDDVSASPVATPVGTIVGATVRGADIAFGSDGTMYLHSNADDTLYTVDYQNPDGNGDIVATPVGTDAGSDLTGLAIRAAGTGDLVGSSRAEDAIIVLEKGTGARTDTYVMTLDGSRYSYDNGDMTTGYLLDETCTECDSDDLLAKYEFACVEEIDDECVAYDFVFEAGDDNLVTYTPGSFESKDGEAFEPVSATFGTDYCTVYALVKAGQQLDVQELVADGGEVTAEYVDPYAISYVAFYCTEEAANAAANAFPSKGRGGGTGRPD